MKKLFYMISAVALMASFASCNKIEQGNTPAETPSAEGTTTITVSADIPQTRTNLSENENGESVVRWSAGDVISVLASGYDPVVSSEVEAASETHNFVVNGWYADVTPQYAAFTAPITSYEYHMPKWNDDGTIQMAVRSDQIIYNQGSFSKLTNISLGELVEKDGVYSTQMKNVCGLLKFTLTKPTKSVEIESVDGNYMCGKVNVKMVNGIPEATLADGSGAKIKITSNVKNSNKVLAHDGNQTYYAIVIPGNYTPKITITPVEGEPIVLTAASPITVKRNEYINLGELDTVAEEGGDEPVETMSITVEMPYPFETNLPTSATKTKDTYKLKDTDYNFVLYNPTDGYRLTSGTLRLSSGTASGYIQFPAVSGWTLTGFDITSGNGTNPKAYCVYANDPIEVTENNDPIANFSLNNGEPYHVDLSNTSAGVGYFLESYAKNAQFTKLVLTYEKVK